MKDFWNQRYGAEAYAYGKDGNAFLKEELAKLSPGKILLPADGEGRNACMAAKMGWDVTAFDYSQEGVEKALKLAYEMDVKINFTCCDYQDFSTKNKFDVVGLIYAHMPNRKSFHQLAIDHLKSGGKLILEGFNKKQLGKDSGGPQKLEMLYNEQELQEDFKDFEELRIWETQTHLTEGLYHVGNAEVIRVIGTKA